MTNKDRARYGIAALEDGQPDYGIADGIPANAAIDAIANILHAYHRENLDENGGDWADAAAYVVERALDHFGEEVDEEEANRC